MVNDRVKIMNSASELEEGPRHKSQRGCSYLLCTVLLFVVVLLAVTVTGAILLMSHYQIKPPVLGGKPPVVSTNQDEDSALVTVDGSDGSRVNVFIDPNCPDYGASFLRLEGTQSSLLRSLADHDSDLRSGTGQENRALLAKLAEEVTRLSAHAGVLRQDNEALRRGQRSLGEELGALQAEQGRLTHLLSESQVNMAKVVTSVSEALSSMQKETGSLRSRLKADLQRAPVRASRAKGCSNGSRPRDCSELFSSGVREDGVYSVFPTHDPAGFQVYCDMTTDGGGWTVIQRREDGMVNFFRGWDAYRDGFGTITGEHWLGLRRMHILTSQSSYELRIDLEDFENSTVFAQYASFGVGLLSVDPEEDGYPLTVADYSGTAGDSLLKHDGMKFTTMDQDNDHSENNCASFYHGAWWYRNCHTSNLNGQYLRGQHTSYADGIEWSSWTGWQYSLKFTEMKIRAAARDESQ